MPKNEAETKRGLNDRAYSPCVLLTRAIAHILFTAVKVFDAYSDFKAIYCKQ